ncbi:unnamed protein product [Discosporangium mesarthrocarpum]
MQMAPTFRDFDRTRRGVIPATMFERALSMLELLPSRRR